MQQQQHVGCLRLHKLRNFLAVNEVSAALILKPENRHYFSGFSGSAGALIITAAESILITDFRYLEQAKQQSSDFHLFCQSPDLYETIAHQLMTLKPPSVAFEADFVTWETFHKLQILVSHAKLIPLKLDSLRMVKDASELSALQTAADIADKTFSHIVTFIKPGLTENEVAWEIETSMRRHGAEKAAFDIIVASGTRSALPHGRASDKVINAGDFVTMDFGAVYKGYHSDITRTVVMGQADGQQRNIYNTVLKAQLSALDSLRAGKTGKEVDSVARSIITDAGYGAHFGHGLGHGVGLVIHEEPRLSPTGEVVLDSNMTVTVEPGIYLAGWGGVRIEDTVVVESGGCRILTASAKHLIEIAV